MTPAAAIRGLRWVLEASGPVGTYYWSSDGTDLTVGDATVPTVGGLDPGDLTEELPVAGAVGDRRSISVALHWPTDAASDAATGLDLSTYTAQLRLLADGQAWEDGRVMVSGPVSEPIYGGVGEPVRLSVGGEPYDDTSAAIPADARISLDTWPFAPESSQGRWYPLVWGEPGVTEDGERLEGPPAYAVAETSGSADTLLLAGHHIEAASVVILYRDSAGVLGSALVTVSNTADVLGRRVATADVSGEASEVRTASEWWWSGQGIRSPYRPGLLQSMGDLARMFAERSTIPQDRAAWAAVAQRFQWRTAGWVSEPATNMEIMRDQVLPSLPIALVWGRNGMRPIRWPYDARGGDAVEHLRESEDCSRVDGVVYERDPRELTQEIRVGFAGDDSRRWVTVAADGYDGARSDITSSLYTRAARARWRTSDVRVREHISPILWTRAAAVQVALWLAAAFAASPRVLEVECGPDRAWLELGDVVRYTSTEISEAATLCIVIARRVGLSGTVRLRLMALPGWDSRARGNPAGASDTIPTWIQG